MTRISARYLAKRLVMSYVTILIIMTLMFLLVRSMPGSFINTMITPDMEPAQVAQLEQRWGVGDPLWVKFKSFIVNYHLFEFGRSPTYKRPVWDVVLARLPRTVILFGASFLIGYVVGPLVGMYLGWYKGERGETAAFAGSLFIYSIPSFWIAWLLIWLFDFELGWLSSTYMFTQFPQQEIGPAFQWTPVTVIFDVLHHIALPLMSLVFIGWVGAMLVMRPTMVEVADSDYVFLAEAKGLSERAVMIKHAGRNALIPVATQAIIGIAFLLDGSVIIEQVFSWPGIGQMLVTSVFNRDFPVMQASFFMLGILIVGMRLVTDIVYTFLDPRIKFGEKG
jgi:peptide/nickel transport system permease protein